MDTTQQDNEAAAGDLLVGAEAIRAFLVHLGMPEGTDAYYLKRTGWPIGNTGTGGRGGGKIIASKRRLANYTAKIARGNAA
jgi:hypothetical protein